MTSLFIYIVSSVFLKDIAVSALSVSLASEVTGVNGSKAEFGISYILDSTENFTRLEFKKLGGTGVFIAPYVQLPSTIDANGRFLGGYASRCSTDYSNGKTNFVITLSQVAPDDEGQFQVDVTANDIITKDAVSRLVVEFPPDAPSISGAPTQPVLGGAGPTVLICTANLGKPQASMVWSRRVGSDGYRDITENVSMSTANSTYGTTYGTSTLTVNLDTANNSVQFRCQVSNIHDTLSTETEAIEVNAPVPVSDDSIQVCKTSTQCTSPFDYYINDQVSLTCGVKSPPPIPAPHVYKWYPHVNESSVTSGPVLSFKIIESEIVYVCNASNIVYGVTRTGSKQVTIRATARPTSLTPSVDTTPSKDTSTKATISDKTTDGTQPDGTLTAGAIAGIAIGAVVVVIILIALAVYCVCKKKADMSKDDAKYMDEGMKNPGMDSPDEGYNTQPDVVAPDQLYAAVNKPKKNKPADPQDPRSKNVEGLVYADLALDDTPRSRKPIQAYELTGTEYAEIMRK